MGLASTVNDTIQFLDVLRTSISAKTKRILAQTGSVTGRTLETVQSEWWQSVGFISRPSKPNPGKEAARCIALRRGNVDAIIASEDDRGLALKGTLLEGETCIYAAGETGTGQARILLKADGAVAIYTLQGNVAGGPSCTIQVLPSGEIHIASPYGGMSVTATKTTVLNATGSGMEMSAAGTNLLGITNVINGSVVLGDGTASGVATFNSMTPTLILEQATFVALQAFLNFPAIQALSGGTAVAAAAAVAALAAGKALGPLNYSLNVKAS